MLGIADRQLLPDHRVDQREERRIGADANREREHRCQGEAGGFRERPARVADVLPGLLEPGPPPLGAGVFGGEREVAELARVGHGGDRPQLFLHVALGRSAPPGQEIPEPSEEHHESASRPPEHAGHGADEVSPLGRLLPKALASRRRQSVDPGAPVLLGHLPLRSDPALQLEALQGRI